MEIRHKQVRDLTPVEYRACLAANFGEWEGYMYEELERCKDGHPGQVIMLWNGPDDTARSLIGWCLLTPVRTYGLLAGTTWTKKRSKFSAQFFVKERFRGKGYGKLLMAEVKKIDPRPNVFPHDEASAEFFSSYDVQYLQSDKKLWYRPKPRIA